MRQPGSWGDHLTLTAISHLTLRPIRVISESTTLPVMINPPDFISHSLWQPEVIVAHQGEFHYEATAPLVIEQTSESVLAPAVPLVPSVPAVGSTRSVADPVPRFALRRYPGTRGNSQASAASSALGVNPRLDPIRVAESSFQDLASAQEIADVGHDPEMLREVRERQNNRKRLKLRVASEIQAEAKKRSSDP